MSPRGKLEIAGVTTIQNGFATHVLQGITAPYNATDSTRYEVARLGVNQVHWGTYGVVTIELFQTYYVAGAYQKWNVQAGYGNYSGSSVLLEKTGGAQFARVTLGAPVLSGTSYLGYPNQYIPVFVEAAYYTTWCVKVTHSWTTTESSVPEYGRLKFFEAPSAIALAATVVTAPDASPSVNGRFSVTGNIGVGITTPERPIHVRGDNAMVRIDRNASAPGFVVGRYSPDWATVYKAFQVYVDGSDADNGVFGIADSHQQMGGGADVRFLIDNVGNVGIGTTAPDYKLSVNGTIKAKEVIVETTGWSDYVFADDYRLAPLSEVEAHIKTEKRLPGIPSELQVAEQGVSVGEMQAALLGKLEEVTLHLIAQEKAIRALQRENAALREQIEAGHSSDKYP